MHSTAAYVMPVCACVHASICACMGAVRRYPRITAMSHPILLRTIPCYFTISDGRPSYLYRIEIITPIAVRRSVSRCFCRSVCLKSNGKHTRLFVFVFARDASCSFQAHALKHHHTSRTHECSHGPTSARTHHLAPASPSDDAGTMTAFLDGASMSTNSPFPPPSSPASDTSAMP